MLISSGQKPLLNLSEDLIGNEHKSCDGAMHFMVTNT